MSLYHVSFKGRRTDEHFQPLRKIQAILEADSIYSVEGIVKAHYEFVTGLCVTNCEWVGRDIFELAS